MCAGLSWSGRSRRPRPLFHTPTQRRPSPAAPVFPPLSPTFLAFPQKATHHVDVALELVLNVRGRVEAVVERVVEKRHLVEEPHDRGQPLEEGRHAGFALEL